MGGARVRVPSRISKTQNQGRLTPSGISKSFGRIDRKKANEETRRKVSEIDSILKDLRQGNSSASLASISLVLGKKKAEIEKGCSSAQVDANLVNYSSETTESIQNPTISPETLVEETIKDFMEKF